MTCQLARFLNEPADYKALVVPTEGPNKFATKAEHMVALKMQIKAIEFVIDKHDSPNTVRISYQAHAQIITKTDKGTRPVIRNIR
jgi:hypothetical protein